jgi:electron transport complex protein RnfG
VADKTVWKVKKDGGDLDAVTGATISSRAVAEAVRTGVEVFLRNQVSISKTGE